MSGIQTLQLGTVYLKAKSKEKMRRFYQEIMGLRVLSDNEKEVLLGADEARGLVHISQLEAGEISSSPRTGLYHTAFLLPSRQDLANLLVHIAQTKYPLDGAGDHIYSEAIYFRDVEGNGIEIYADRPQAEWQRAENGDLPMATNEVDIDGLLAEADHAPFEQIAAGTIIGHVHLQVADIEKTETFYQGLLGLNLTTTIPSARFFAAGTYHHHLGTNVWSGRNLSPRQDNETGLDFFTIHTPQHETVKTLLAENGYPIVESATGFFTEDPNGIRIFIGK